jgi:starch synthase
MTLEPDRPLFVFFGPLDEQHGADLVMGALDGILKTGARLIVAGDGEQALVGAMEDAVASSENDAIYVGEASAPMKHRLVAAADAVLVPSRYEPCGLVQQVAQRYGAPPVARAVGGLVDTVVDCDVRCESGTGFLFDEVSPEALVGAVQRAVAAMKTPVWGGLRRRVMRLDVSWERPARRYARLYQSG